MSYTHISSTERLEISILYKKGYSHREIASALSRSQSSVSREITRNRVKGIYQPTKAHTKARVRRKQSKYQGMKVREHKRLRDYIVEKLELHWTPEQIAGRLKYVDATIGIERSSSLHMSQSEQRDQAGDDIASLPYISTKGIYKWLYSQHGQQYCHLLPSARYSKKKRGRKKIKRVMIPNRTPIQQRPWDAAVRNTIGHCEEDTMVSGKRHRTFIQKMKHDGTSEVVVSHSTAALAVLCDRSSRYTTLSLMESLSPRVHVTTQVGMIERLQETVGMHVKTITYDNGIENKDHMKLADALSLRTFFCDPYSSWQKGTVENTIGRIRRFIPKGADLAVCSSEEICRIEDWLNHTPRKILNYRTPYEIMTQSDPFISMPSSTLK